MNHFNNFYKTMDNQKKYRRALRKTARVYRKIKKLNETPADLLSTMEYALLCLALQAYPPTHEGDDRHEKELIRLGCHSTGSKK